MKRSMPVLVLSVWQCVGTWFEHFDALQEKDCFFSRGEKKNRGAPQSATLLRGKMTHFLSSECSLISTCLIFHH